MLYKQTLLAAAILISTTPIHALAGSVDSVYLHDKKQALSEYSKYKSNKSNNVDPFEKVREGYNSNLSKTIENTIRYDKQRTLDISLSDEAEALDSNLTNSSKQRQAEKIRLYNLYKSDGYFNRNAYLRDIENINKQIKDSSDAILNSRTTNLNNVINNANSQLERETSSTEANAQTAARNLVEIMNNESQGKLSAIDKKITDAKSASTFNYRVGGQAEALADNWDENCGSACDLPPPPPPPTTEPDPEDPWDKVAAGCYVDTIKLDQVTSNSCFSLGYRRMGQPASISFSVGNDKNPDNYFFDTPVSVRWTGDCTGSSPMCSIFGRCTTRSCTGLGTMVATAVVTMNGETRSFKVTARDRTKVLGGEVDK